MSPRHPFTCRLTEAERSKLIADARAHRMTESEYVRRLIADGLTEASDRGAIHQAAGVTEALLEKVAFMEDIVARIGTSQDPEFVAEARERAQAYARSTCRAA